MKKITFLILMSMSILATSELQAQVGFSVNIGVQPVWGPVGYEHVDYYYLPDVDAYYDVPARVYVYNEGGVWVRRSSLPPAYVNYDLYHGYKVVVNDPNPWLRHTVYHDKYIGYKGRHDQVVIRDSREPRYYEVKEHPMHDQWHPENHQVEHNENHGENRGGEHRGGGGEHGGGEHKGGGGEHKGGGHDH